jgi:TrpR-related protein YerC/YecD
MVSDPMQSPDVQQLIRALLLLRTPEECANFLADISTISELKSLAQRLEVARLLQAGCTYTHIEAATGASTATISRVNRFLQYGAGGYELMLARLAEQET